MKAHLSAIATSAGLLFLMWLFLYFPTIHGEDLRLRIGCAGLGLTFALTAYRSGKLGSKLELYTLAGSAAIGMVVVLTGLITHFL